MDGRGTLMAKRSSVINDNRNPGMTQAQAEAIFTEFLGVTNFIWVDGTPGIDITDDHIGKASDLLASHFLARRQLINALLLISSFLLPDIRW